MSQPTIELIPAKPAVCSDASITLDVLIRITPPKPEVYVQRPPLNLALVLDRSGSMQGAKKMANARDAAIFAVRQLLPTDRVSVTIFDSEVETVVANTPAADKTGIERKIRQIEPRGSTDLHGGWLEGARQARGGQVDGGLNRVLLLSDGLANMGVTEPNAIAADVRGMVAKGIGTTTLGVGADYNEDLMEAMARAGDGNYYYIESPVQLTDIFQTELEGLMATVGQKVSLGLEPEAGAGVVVADVLNDFDKVATGRLMLPNLIVGMPIQVVVRLSIPPQGGGKFLAPLAVRFAWDAPKGKGGKVVRQTLRARLDPLPALALAVFSDRPSDPTVLEQEALLMIARAQKEAALALDRGDRVTTLEHLALARGYTADLAMSPYIEAELSALDEIEAAVDEGNDAHATKSAKSRSYLRRTSRSSPPTKPEA
jgi:Ca-activated chloride channel family protein